MGKIIRRHLSIDLPPGKSAFLWGPRKTGKSYWIKHHLKPHTLIDLLMTDVFAEYASRPSLLRERLHDARGIVVVDEIQKVPALLDEVHWLIENKGISFLLTGSSARKLKHGHANMLGGRAWRREMYPLSFTEVSGFDLEKVMVTGMLPPHFLSPAYKEEMRSYVADYLKEEIAAEARVQNIPSFSEFLRIAALTSSELLNYTNVASEVDLSQKQVRTYFDILEDTLLGFRLQPWRKSKNRRMILTEKFYLFDVGVANFLMGRVPAMQTPEFGKSFEHFILMELRAYAGYCRPDTLLSYWRSASGQEVDFIVGDKQLALEVKGSSRINEASLGSLRAIKEDGPVKHRVVVSLEKQARTLSDGIIILPWKQFLESLWNGEYF